MTQSPENQPEAAREPRRSFARVRRTRPYRALAGAWERPVLLACSGGADSMALLVVAAAARAAGRVGPVVVAHVDHRTRPEIEEERGLVADQAQRFGLPFVATWIDERCKAGFGGVEAELRELRYASLARVGRVLGIEHVVTAHTRSDQVETVLLRLLAGSAPLGAAGMNRETTLPTPEGPITVLRPWLDIEREELLQVLAVSSTPYAEDPSNSDPRFRRNRVRHELIPLLTDIAPGFAAALLRSVDLARQDAEVVSELSDRMMPDVVRKEGGVRWIARDFLSDQPEAIAGRVLKMTAEELAPGDAREITRERILAVHAAAKGRTGAVIELPYGLRAVVEADAVRIERGEG